MRNSARAQRRCLPENPEEFNMIMDRITEHSSTMPRDCWARGIEIPCCDDDAEDLRWPFVQQGSGKKWPIDHNVNGDDMNCEVQCCMGGDVISDNNG